MRRFLSAAAAAVLLAAAGACGDDDDGGTGPTGPAAVSASTPPTMTATAGAAVATPPAVRVADARGRPVADVPVAFAVTAGGGSVGTPNARTDANGVASAGSWTLGTAAGEQQVTATVAGLETVRFTATARPGAAAALAGVGGQGQTAIAGSVLADSLAVRVTDANGNPVPGVAVAFAVTAGAGTLSASSAATRADGVAKVRLTLAPQPGPVTVTASAAGLAPVAFAARAMSGPPGRMVVHAGDEQTASAGATVATAPAVRVTDVFGNGVAGVPVRFAAAGGGGRITGANAVTDSVGVAAVGSWTLGGGAGTQSLTATADGVGAVTITATATANPASALAEAGGQDQSGVAGSALADSLAVRALDAFGNPVAGVAVTFAVTSGEGTLSTTGATTRADGTARVRLTLGRTPGAVAVRASAPGVAAPVVFAARAVAGAPARLLPHAGDDQAAAPGAAVATRPAVRLTDALGNGLAGHMVRFQVTGGGGRVTGATAVTDTSGVAAVGSWVLGGGENSLTATSHGLDPVVFTARVTDPCAVSTAYAVGDTARGALAAGDCTLSGGQRIDFYSMTLGQARELVLDLRGSPDPLAYLFSSTGHVVAADDNTGGGTDARIHVIAPAGSYFVGASSSTAPATIPVPVGTTGYTLTSGAAPAATGCMRRWVIPGITTNQEITSEDLCDLSWRADWYYVQLRAGQSVTLNLMSDAFDSYLAVFDPSGFFVASDDDSGEGLNSRLVFTAPVAGRYTIRASSLGGFSLGAYTFSVQ